MPSINSFRSHENTIWNTSTGNRQTTASIKFDIIQEWGRECGFAIVTCNCVSVRPSTCHDSHLPHFPVFQWRFWNPLVWCVMCHLASTRWKHITPELIHLVLFPLARDSKRSISWHQLKYKHKPICGHWNIPPVIRCKLAISYRNWDPGLRNTLLCSTSLITEKATVSCEINAKAEENAGACGIVESTTHQP